MMAPPNAMSHGLGAGGGGGGAFASFRSAPNAAEAERATAATVIRIFFITSPCRCHRPLRHRWHAGQAPALSPLTKPQLTGRLTTMACNAARPIRYHLLHFWAFSRCLI